VYIGEYINIYVKK